MFFRLMGHPVFVTAVHYSSAMETAIGDKQTNEWLPPVTTLVLNTHGRLDLASGYSWPPLIYGMVSHILRC